MKNRISLLAIVSVIIISLACGSSTEAPPTEPETPTEDSGVDVVATTVAATMAAEPNQEVSPTPTFTDDPGVDNVATSVAATLQAAQPSSTPTIPPPMCLPAHPGAQPPPAANGLAAGVSGSDAITLYDLQGSIAGTKTATGLSWPDELQVHLGGTSGGISALPVVYNTLTGGGGNQLSSVANGLVSGLITLPNIVAITGAPGETLFAFSTSDSDAGGWLSNLYATSLSNAASAAPLLTRSEGDGFVYLPLAVRTNSGQILGVWYTLSLYGIGNINFQPYRGLYYFDLGSSLVTEYLAFDMVIGGFSPDHSWVAFSPNSDFAQPQSIFILKNLLTCQEVFLPFDPGSNQNGGYVKFSPDNQLVAWMEASGTSPMDAQFRLRVARIDGNMLVDAPINTLAGLAGGEIPNWLSTLGWIDNHLLVLRIGVSNGGSLLVMWAPDPNQPLDPVLGANQSVLLASGAFLGFSHP
ncbi:MAG: hypothetical protein FVQ83_09625 [Chloroflexi bacterium]|nr:hypothetical protein [Chloroflexota bacterium]